MAAHPPQGHPGEAYPHLHGPDRCAVQPPEWPRHTHETDQDTLPRGEHCGGGGVCWSLHLTHLQAVQCDTMTSVCVCVNVDACMCEIEEGCFYVNTVVLFSFCY